MTRPHPNSSSRAPRTRGRAWGRWVALAPAALTLACLGGSDETVRENGTSSDPTDRTAAVEQAALPDDPLVADAMASRRADDQQNREELERQRAELEAREAELAEREEELQREEQRRAAELDAQQRARAEERRRELEREAEIARFEAERAAAQEAERQRVERLAESERTAAAPTSEPTEGESPEPSVAEATPEDETALRRASLPPVDPEGRTEGGGDEADRSDIVADEPGRATWSGDESWRSGGSDVSASDDGGDVETASAAAEIDLGRTARNLRPGTRFEVEISETVSSADAVAGDVFSTHLTHDIVDPDGNLLVPAGTELRGTVTQAKKMRKVGGRASLGVVIDRMVFENVDGEPVEIEIRASLETFGRDRRRDKFRIAGAALAGAILGGIFGDAEGAVAGAAAGAAASTAAVARSKGEDVELPAGEVIELELEEVVTVRGEFGPVVRE